MHKIYCEFESILSFARKFYQSNEIYSTVLTMARNKRPFANGVNVIQLNEPHVSTNSAQRNKIVYNRRK